MIERNRELLDAELERQFEELKKLNLATDQYEQAIKNLSVLAKINLDLDKIDMDYEEEYTRREMDKEKTKHEEEQRKEDEKSKKIDRYVNYGIAGFGILSELALTKWMFKKSMKFEQTGSWTSSTPRVIEGFKRLSKSASGVLKKR